MSESPCKPNIGLTLSDWRGRKQFGFRMFVREYRTMVRGVAMHRLDSPPTIGVTFFFGGRLALSVEDLDCCIL
jgi:hypothetical protein